jgi:hypothetical protein
VGERLGVGEVVDGDEVEVGDALLLGGAEDLTADAPKPLMPTRMAMAGVLP